MCTQAVRGILTRALLLKTAGRGAAGPYFIMLFKGPIRLQLLNGKAYKSYIIHVKDMEKAQQLFTTAHCNTERCWEGLGMRQTGKGREWKDKGWGKANKRSNQKQTE